MPPLVHEVLRSQGQPLESEARAFFEPRFGHELSRVRVHTDEKAAESARAVSALAYTVGRDMVFGANQYAPRTGEGKKLLAHELTHVVQQGMRAAPGASMAVEQGSSAQELEADHVASSLMRGLGGESVNGESQGKLLSGNEPMLRIQTSAVGCLSKQKAPDSTKKHEETQLKDQKLKTAPPTDGFVCGPDVTKQIKDAVTKVRSAFWLTWSPEQRKGACSALTSLRTGGYAWDVHELHNNAWILGYRPECATQGASPHCGSSVKVEKDCHYAGSANYVIFGTMCRLCHTFLSSIGSGDADDFTKAEALQLVDKYKGTGLTGLAEPSANFKPSLLWTQAGYERWPDTAGPEGDRKNCLPSCAKPYAGGNFLVHWVPHGWF